MLGAAGLTQSSINYRRHIMPLVAEGLLDMSIPDRPNSPAQRHILTETGKQMLTALEQTDIA
jgi:ATP-dependent DNA helicase RecG